jgi:hypothetical protein
VSPLEYPLVVVLPQIVPRLTSRLKNCTCFVYVAKCATPDAPQHQGPVRYRRSIRIGGAIRRPPIQPPVPGLYMSPPILGSCNRTLLYGRPHISPRRPQNTLGVARIKPYECPTRLRTVVPRRDLELCEPVPTAPAPTTFEPSNSPTHIAPSVFFSAARTILYYKNRTNSRVLLDVRQNTVHLVNHPVSLSTIPFR